MKSLMAFLCIALISLPVQAGRDDPRLARSRAIAGQFQQALGGRLMSAMQAGGPVEAISVCKEQAPAIAARLSEETGARVGRTALRLRNTGNAPDTGQRAVMEDFQKTLAAGADGPPEHFQANADGGALYMKAIVTQDKCLACHGSKISPGVEAALDKHYPADKATGFKTGDLRGAFVIEWPAAGESNGVK